jgi:hypothetical protein
MKNELKIKAKVVEVHTESGDIISTIKQISPPKRPQIYAQICKSRDSGGIGDIIRAYLGMDAPELLAR